ncbi:hypothetical protein A2996_00865 [Candidatus Campbellbacteria bacterium RIFCSPLOWO2_01_FULL_34_15]|uniref:Uncharacterized protein n=2 Tax=Candidatus Campbelliibacteriota TaxID=1752727 RepID=A0A1F5EMX3_9BACT|nr:MAG: hypothetical protein A2811_00690 [Candidatus Campbellbacteria bacterium RIFCSPHIGHO2_01_FULL_34_10]OGD68758.1 MAG: hypothetical protein A2996_00865 [Candidatus Campbellbacteria bacterium RIFCSPLOWO2_01_FULL_34_15]
MDNYKSFVGANNLKTNYDVSDLEKSGYNLTTRCNKNNPDCKRKIKEKKEAEIFIKVIELNSKDYGEDMIDIWEKTKLNKN